MTHDVAKKEQSNKPRLCEHSLGVSEVGYLGNGAPKADEVANSHA
jgi:hypothetical protein